MILLSQNSDFMVESQRKKLFFIIKPIVSKFQIWASYEIK